MEFNFALSNTDISTQIFFILLKDFNTVTEGIQPQMVTRTKKIFVGGLSAPTTLEDVKSYFEQFGTMIHKFTLYTNVMWVIC
ncbi:CLUMA_CG009573, isoform A [Clunio marinus]|uniref:CLUMA_CG009573, isoform A n=1 Tax=Clunio marinus TaxID=568069 RepID=A0A1J1I755_9DIPT|nr:CLUMA_CG009573, isoform A [Clunio marinus]